MGDLEINVTLSADLADVSGNPFTKQAGPRNFPCGGIRPNLRLGRPGPPGTARPARPPRLRALAKSDPRSLQVPFAVCRAGFASARTKTMNNAGKTATWNEQLRLPGVEPSSVPRLLVEVFHEGLLSWAWQS